MTINSTKYSVFAFLVVVGLLTGCQNNSVDSEFRIVTGTVFLNDLPVEGARVTFFPLDTSGLAASGLTDASGKYLLTADGSLSGGTGTKPGQYRVTVKKTEILADKNREDFEAGKISQEELMKRQYTASQNPVKPKNLLPKIYADQSKSPLGVIVEDKKQNAIDFRLN
jgi:hypothetical protein